MEFETKKTATTLYGGVVAYKISVKFVNGQSAQRHTYWKESGKHYNSPWIESLLTIDDVKNQNSGFNEKH